jgi:hypothetical protein
MVMRIIYPLNKADMDDFLSIFPDAKIEHIYLNLYNGTMTRNMELPNGSTAVYLKFQLQCESKEAMTKDLERVDHNQIQSCEVHLSKDGEYGTVSLNLLDHEMSFQEKPSLFSTDKLLTFARTKHLDKVTIRFG